MREDVESLMEVTLLAERLNKALHTLSMARDTQRNLNREGHF